jgi:hypothetical protein
MRNHEFGEGITKNRLEGGDLDDHRDSVRRSGPVHTPPPFEGEADFVTYDDLLVELCASPRGDLGQRELARRVSRTEDEVLGALSRLRELGVVRYLERDLDRDARSDDRWAPAGSLQALRVKTWLEDAPLDLMDDISSALDEPLPSPFA